MASPKGPPFTVPRYGSLGESIIAERDWLKRQNDQLRGTLSLAEEGLANYAQEVEGAKHDIDRLMAACNHEANEVERLRAALSRYGHHDGDCEWALTDGAPCSCGLLSLIRGAEPQFGGA